MFQHVARAGLHGFADAVAVGMKSPALLYLRRPVWADPMDWLARWLMNQSSRTVISSAAIMGEAAKESAAVKEVSFIWIIFQLMAYRPLQLK